MVTLSFRIEDIDGCIACHQRTDEENMTDAERAVAMLMAKKVAEGIPQWLAEVTGCEVKTEELSDEDREAILTPKVPDVNDLIKKVDELQNNPGDDWKTKLKELMEMLPEEIRDEIQNKMILLGDTFDISKGFGPLNRVYDQNE